MRQTQINTAGNYLQGFNALRDLQQPQRQPENALSMQYATPERNNALAMNGGPTRAAANALSGGSGLAQGIIETAAELGMDPVDLATIISYETAGTFDPRKKGPTTQWGQHEGLIQWGQPQQRQFGVDLSSEDAALRSQLGRGGAIVRYFQNAGFRPGMGLLDAYSAVNAGRVGRYNASDANNGGAPGTVRDKVQNQMSGHRAKAIALLGG